MTTDSHASADRDGDKLKHVAFDDRPQLGDDIFTKQNQEIFKGIGGFIKTLASPDTWLQPHVTPHTVQPEDSLWSIAQQSLKDQHVAYKDKDIDRYTRQIAQRNGIKNRDRIQDGAMLQIPDYQPDGSQSKGPQPLKTPQYLEVSPPGGREKAPPETRPRETPEVHPEKSEKASAIVADPAGRPLSGRASTYGYDHQNTSSGERVDANGLTAASAYWPNGTILRVKRVDQSGANGKTVEVRVNDWGPDPDSMAVRGDPTRNLDLSPAAAKALGFSASGEGVIHYQAELVKMGAGPEKPLHIEHSRPSVHHDGHPTRVHRRHR